MQVNPHTKIAAILNYHPEALETIVSLNPKFEKLRNPFLRKLMAGRVSISMAAKIAGCAEEDFFGALKSLGFETEGEKEDVAKEAGEMPSFLQSLDPKQVVSLDVRPLLEAGNDPLKKILATIKELRAGEVLKIINTFEPTPLIAMLRKKGYQSWTDSIGPQLIETWFFRESVGENIDSPERENEKGDLAHVMKCFVGYLQEIDVRELEMPQPMMKILESLESLPEEHALFVLHKRIPVFLLPELAQRGFEYRSRQLSEDEVHLIIFRN